jgi:hypothetical protein
VEQEHGPGLRRTRIRRNAVEIAAAGERLGLEAAQMADPDVLVYPSPSEETCKECRYIEPCLAVTGGATSEELSQLLASRYRTRPAEAPSEAKLGSRTWSFGRGAAPSR